MPTVVIAASIIHVLASAFRAATTLALARCAEGIAQRVTAALPAVTVAAVVVVARHV
jgi:hypothetical protein